MEFAVFFLPGGDLVGAICVAEELKDHIVLVVAQTGRKRIHEGVGGQIGSRRGDAGQSTDDLIVDHIAVRGGAGMGKAVTNVGGAATVLAGVGLGLAQGLFQRGDTGEVLGIQSNVIDPTGAAVARIRAIDRSHRHGHEEGSAGFRDHFGDLRLHKEVQTEGQIFRFGVTVGVGFRHLGAATGNGIILQRVLYDGCIILQGSLERVDQHIGLVVVILNSINRLIGLGIAVIYGHANGREKGITLGKTV